MSNHTLPQTLPISWLASFKLPSAEGRYESFKVIREVDGEFVVHTASYKDDSVNAGDNGWFYLYGSYHRTLEAAQASFVKTITGLVA